MRTVLLSAWGMLALLAQPARADDAPAAPRHLETIDFFRHPLIGDAQISPSGRYLAVLVPNDRKTRLDIVDTATLRATAAYEMGGREFIVNFKWINDEQLVWEGARRRGTLDQPFFTGNLMIGRADKSQGKTLGDAQYFLARVRDEPNSILVTWGRKIYKENVDSGAIDPVADVPFAGGKVFTDHAGKVRLATGYDGDDFVTDTWDEAKSSWKELSRSRSFDGGTAPLSFAGDNHHLYVSSDVEAPTKGIYLSDLASGDSKLLFRDGEVDVDGSSVIEAPNTGEPAGVLYFPDYPAYRFFDESSAIAKTYAELRKAFPGALVRVTSSSDDGRLSVVSVQTDRQPEVLYLLDARDRSLRKLFASQPWIDPRQMSPMTAFTMKARDGVELHGYLTLPLGGSGRNLPVVVLPHGGPHGAHDVWGFNEEVQFLAYHGYAVLQLNYRGSDGYGRQFEDLGLGHWGTTMQDDLTDATRWVAAQGIADPRRICIYGASYGGYAALMGVIREPELYRCAASYVGITDLQLNRRYSDIGDTSRGRAFLDRAVGTDPDDLKARSPVYNVDKIKVPLFLAAGGRDRRVPVENFNAMLKALKKAGKVYEYVLSADEGHGYYDEQNLVGLYDDLASFLDRNTAPPAPSATTASTSP